MLRQPPNYTQIVCFVLLFLVIPFSATFPAELLEPRKVETSDEPVSIVADVVTYDRNERLYIAQGDVEIYWGNQTLEANHVQFSEDTQIARAIGDVTLTKEEGTLDCEYLEINLDTRQGQIQEGYLFYKEGNVYLSGKNLEKLGENRYLLESGEITTCDGDRPPWKISYKKADVTVEGLAEVRNATFKVKNIPVLYTPYLLFPVKTKRQTGFMLPSFGHSNSDGAYLNNEFFWAISESTDATFYLDTATEKGFGFGSEYRYVTSENGHGRLYGYVTHERSSYQKDEYDNPEGRLDRKQDRWNLVYEGKEDFTDDLFFRAKVDLVSDRQFYTDYGYQTVQRTAESIQSSAFLTNHWNQQGFSLVGDIEYNKDLEEDYQKQDFEGVPPQDQPDPINRYPQVMLTGLPRLLSGSPLYCSLDSSYNNFYRNRGVEGSRVDMNPQLTLPMVFWKNYLFETEGGILQTIYLDTHNKEQGENFDDTRTLFTFRSALSSKFMKVFQSSDNPHKKYRHTIEPELSYHYIPHKHDQVEDYPQYDKRDNVMQENRFVIALTNRLMSKVFRPESPSAETEVLYVRLGEAYDASTSNEPFSNSFLEIRTRPMSFLYFESDLEYDFYDSEFDVFNVLAQLEDRRGDHLSVDYRYADHELDETRHRPADPSLYFNGSQNDGITNIEALTTNATVVVTDWLSAFFRSRHDLHANRDLETTVGFEYQAQCWGAILSYRKRASTDGRDSNKKIMLEFILKGIGRVGGFDTGT